MISQLSIFMFGYHATENRQLKNVCKILYVQLQNSISHQVFDGFQQFASQNLSQSRRKFENEAKASFPCLIKQQYFWNKRYS